MTSCSFLKKCGCLYISESNTSACVHCEQFNDNQGALTFDSADLTNSQSYYVSSCDVFLLQFEKPIRTLDLRACSAVQFDYSQDRINCFW